MTADERRHARAGARRAHGEGRDLHAPGRAPRLRAPVAAAPLRGGIWTTYAPARRRAGGRCAVPERRLRAMRAAKFALEQIRAGARAAGRDPSSLDVGCTIYGSLHDDETLARQERTPMAAWFPPDCAAIRRAGGRTARDEHADRRPLLGGHFDDAQEAFPHVTGEMIDRFTVAGPPEVWNPAHPRGDRGRSPAREHLSPHQGQARYGAPHRPRRAAPRARLTPSRARTDRRARARAGIRRPRGKKGLRRCRERE